MTGSIMKWKLVKALLAVAFWGLLWQWAAVEVGQELMLPTPACVLTSLGGLVVTPLFWQSAALTLGRILAGLVLGSLLGLLLAGLTTWVPLADWILSPGVRVVRAVPVASFILLMWLWVSANQVPGLIAALMVLPVVWENVSRGLREVDGKLLELCYAYGFGRWKRLRLLYAPSALPYFASGCHTALGLAWKAGVAAEVLCMPKTGIGTQILRAKNGLDSPALFAWTLLVVALSFLLEWVLGAGLQRLEERGRGHGTKS